MTLPLPAPSRPIIPEFSGSLAFEKKNAKNNIGEPTSNTSHELLSKLSVNSENLCKLLSDFN